MKKILGILILGLLLQGCGAPNNYHGFKNYWQKRGYTYFAEACPESGRRCWWNAAYSQADANRAALNSCNRSFGNCAIFREGNRTVGGREDINIATAQNTCRKVGYSEGTEAFADCTIKILTQATQQGSQTVIVGQRRIFPRFLNCRDIGAC